jgi:glutamate racemase
MLKMDVYNNESGERQSDGRLDFEGEHFIYYGDQANMPYGNYSAAGKSEYLKKLIVDDADFLLSKKAKIVVIACNTATAWGLDKVSERTCKADSSTIGVIGAGVGSSLSLKDIASAQGDISIGVMATPGTIASGAYERTILAEAKKRGIKARIRVFSQGCAGLADAVEAGSRQANIIAVENYRELMKKHAAAVSAGPMKAVILGCTHYPFVLSALKKEAGAMTFVNPALATAEECYLRLRKDNRLRRHGKISLSAYISVPAKSLDKRFLDKDGNLTYACKYSRELQDSTIWTDIKSYSARDAVNNGFIREMLPASWALLSASANSPCK